MPAVALASLHTRQASSTAAAAAGCQSHRGRGRRAASGCATLGIAARLGHVRCAASPGGGGASVCVAGDTHRRQRRATHAHTHTHLPVACTNAGCRRLQQTGSQATWGAGPWCGRSSSAAPTGPLHTSTPRSRARSTLSSWPWAAGTTPCSRARRAACKPCMVRVVRACARAHAAPASGAPGACGRQRVRSTTGAAAAPAARAPAHLPPHVHVSLRRPALSAQTRARCAFPRCTTWGPCPTAAARSS
jgi:hypothetical protein